jgi:methylmalonyl-CoA mutase
MYAELEKDFPSTTYAEWKIAVEKELKGLSFQDLLVQSDDIEQLTFSKFSAFENVQNEKPLDFRILDRSSNDWEINQLIEVKDEKVANKEALHALQLGASSLTFILEKKAIQWNLLFANIELKYIQTVFHCQTEEHTLGIQDYFKTQVGSEPILAQDFQEEISGSNAVSIKSFHIQQAGANAIQEVAFALSAANEVLAKGQVSTLILEMGIGSKYMIEIAKFRTLRWLLNGLKNQYEFKGQIRLIARTTFVNKSLKDPHTNLLRQTTEAMSAIWEILMAILWLKVLSAPKACKS